MPTISLRLSDEEHEALRKWAFEGRRSIQREIIFRLFAKESEVVSSSAGFITPQGREEAAKTMTGNSELIDQFPQSAPRGVNPGKCGMSNRHHMNSKQNPCPRCGYPA